MRWFSNPTATTFVIGAFVTIQIGGNWVQWHFRFGYATLALILFRILWGLFGDRYSRFSSFLYGPASIVAYLKGGGKAGGARALAAGSGAPESPGHNPLGSLSVYAMIGFLLLQPLLGLFANDDIASEGPFARFISKELSDTLTGWHHRGKPVLIALVVLHLGAIAFYAFFRKKNLVRPMITGDKVAGVDANGKVGDVPAGTSLPQPARDDGGVRVRALGLMAISVAVVYVLVTL